MALYQHRMSGGDVATAPVISPVIPLPAASAATLGAFKSNLSSLTTSITTAFPGAIRGRTGSAAPAPPALGQEGYSAALLTRVSGQAVGGPPGGARNPSTMVFTDAMSRTKEGFSKLFQTTNTQQS